MKKYKSDAFEAIHEDAMADFEIGAISEARMKEYDEMCLVQEPEPPYEATSPITEPVTAAQGI